MKLNKPKHMTPEALRYEARRIELTYDHAPFDEQFRQLRHGSRFNKLYEEMKRRGMISAPPDRPATR